MQKKTIIIIGIALLALISGACFYVVKYQNLSQLSSSQILQTQIPAQSEQPNSEATPQTNSMQQLPSTSDKAQTSTSSSELINKPTLSIDKRVVKKSIANTYNHMIDYDLNFVQLTGTYKGIDSINEYYNSKEKDDFFGEKNNNWFNIPYPYDTHFSLQFYYHAEVQYGNILSVSGSGNFWAGGVNNPTIYSDVFDLNTGKKLALSDIFNISKNEYLNLIYEEVSKSINKEITEGQNRYTFTDAYSTDGKAAIAKFQPENFYLTGDSLVVFYPKYSLGAGAAGAFMFKIPLDSIKDKLMIELIN